jgi:NAD(P)H dehydrogenase (quinone)
MLLVTGANGNLGGRVVAHLRTLVGPSGFIAATRNPQSDFAKALETGGVGVRRADFDDPAGLVAAFEGVEAVLIISTYADNSVRLRQNLNALEGAKAAGVRRIVYTSFVNASAGSLAEHNQRVHHPTEQAIMASGLSYTILRHALYADILVNDLDETLGSGILHRAAGTRACAYIARDDLGLSAATVLAGSGHDNRVYTETMPKPMTGDEAARAIGEVFGREIRYQAIPAERWPSYMAEKWGVPEHLARSSLGTLHAIEAGEFDVCSPDYEKITGRKPRSFEEFLHGVKTAREAASAANGSTTSSAAASALLAIPSTRRH